MEVTIAALCTRGHLISLEAVRGMGGHCDECGAVVITGCLACDLPIYGVRPEADYSGNLDTSGWTRPAFCPQCGTAFPWVDRQGRIYALENLLQQEKVGEADRLKIREELATLTDGDLSEREQVKRWKRVKELSPGLWERGGAIIQDLVTDYAKRKLNL